MASPTLTPYASNVTQLSYALVNTSEKGSGYKLAGRALGTPYSVTIERKIGPSGAATNDHVIVRLQSTSLNATTKKPVTGLITLDISIPRDSATVTSADMVSLLGVCSSLLNDSTALAATTVARTALVEGRDL